MRILITGSRYWHCRRAMIEMMHRMIEKHGAENLTFVHGGDTHGAENAMKGVCEDFKVSQEVHPVDWTSTAEMPFSDRNNAMIKLGAEMCIVFTQDLKNTPNVKDLTTKAILHGIPTWLIDNDDAKPTKLKATDPRLEKTS